MLPNGTKISDIDRAAEDHPDERPCEVCGHDAGECTCDDVEDLGACYERNIARVIMGRP